MQLKVRNQAKKKLCSVLHFASYMFQISFQYCSEMAKQQIDEAEKILHTFNISSDVSI